LKTLIPKLILCSLVLCLFSCSEDSIDSDLKEVVKEEILFSFEIPFSEDEMTKEELISFIYELGSESEITKYVESIKQNHESNQAESRWCGKWYYYDTGETCEYWGDLNIKYRVCGPPGVIQASYVCLFTV